MSTATVSSLPTITPTNVLIVEDEAIIAMALSEVLQEIGYTVADVAQSGLQAIELARRLGPDIVLMDVVLQGEMDGIAAATAINSERRVPIVYCSAYGDGATVKRAARSGALGFITKPYQPDQVRATIETALTHSRLEGRLRESEEWFSATLRSVGDAVLAIDAGGRVAFVNQTAEQLLRIRMNDVVGRPIDDVVRIETREPRPFRIRLFQEVLARRKPVSFEFGATVFDANGKRIPIEDSLTPIESQDGHVIGAVMVFRDVSERMRLERELAHTERLYQNAFDLAAAGIAVVDLDGRIERANPALHELLGYESGSLEGRAFEELVHPAYREREHRRRRALVEGQAPSFNEETLLVSRRGNEIWGLVSGAVLRNGGSAPTAHFLQIIDIRHQKAVERKLAHMARFDPLTGLVNRRGLQQELARAAGAARRHGNRFGVLFVDIDNFKNVNDTFGHEAGDRLLVEIGHRLKTLARQTDVIARMGGDEFVILVGDLEEPSDVGAVAEKFRGVVAGPTIVGQHEVHLSASVGVSLFPDDAADVVDLLRYADTALYQAKSVGRDCVAFYRSELTERTGERLRLESALRRAIDHGGLELHYQPICYVASDGGAALEALVRWRRGDHLLLPGAFLGIAEETGLIVAIGDWALREACSRAARWERELGPVEVSVNVSARQIRYPGFVDSVASALERSGLKPELLVLEFTENQFFGVSAEEMQTLEELRDLGVKLVVDDFGVGYSSLSYLKRFNPHRLKIDRSFINDVIDDPSDAAIVSATIAMAHKLGMTVVAEGVESVAQLEFLRDEGCDAVQGYYLSEPLPAGSVPRFFSDFRLPKT